LRAFRRKTVEYDPVWCFHPKHVHFLLECIHDYWSNNWDIEPSTVPRPFPRKGPPEQKALARQLNAEAKSDRISILDGEFDKNARRILQSAAPGLFDEITRHLYASILQRAVLDWTDNCVSAYQDSQRAALSAYWWIMGIPFPQPLGMSFRGELDVARGRTRRYQLPPKFKNPLPQVSLGLASLWIFRDSSPGMPKYFASDDHVTFLDCCSVIDVNPDEIRRILHLIPPQN